MNLPRVFLATVLLFPVCFSGRPVSSSPNLIIRFHPMVRDSPLVFGTNYQNTFGETFSISRLRFYLGNPGLDSGGGAATGASRYFLVDLGDSNRACIALQCLPGSYHLLRFQLGIDSLDQTGGAESGPLDPVQGMFWTWNSGYVTLKIEGLSPESDQPFHAITYHIGGYRYPDATIIPVHIYTAGKLPVTVSDNAITCLDIPVDIDRFFNNPHPLRIAQVPACTTPGKLARQCCLNFSAAFREMSVTSKPKP
jgi:hypothetical protein